jgi:PAS domain S-box-containing protein
MNSDQAAEALRKSEERFTRAFHSSPAALAIARAGDGHIIEANESFLELTGYSREEVLADHSFRSLGLLPSLEQRDRVGEIFRQQGFVRQVEFVIRHKSGVLRTVILSVEQIELDGQACNLLSALDITERKRAEDALRLSEQKFATAFRISPDAVNINRLRDGLYIDINDGFTALTGYTRSDVIGRSSLELNIWADPADRARLVQGMRERGEVTNLEALFRRKDGTTTTALMSARLVQIDGELCTLSITRDISERKRAEELLMRRTAELTVLQATVLDITSHRPLPELLHLIVERAANLLNATAGGMYLNEPDQRRVRCVVSHNTPRDVTGTLLNHGEGAAGTVAQTGQPLIIDDYRVWSGRAGAFENAQPFQAVISAPLLWHGQVSGVLHVLRYGDSRPFTREDLNLLTLFATHAATAVENARLRDALEQELAERRRVEAEITRLNEELERRVAERTAELSDLYNNAPCGYHSLDAQGIFERINDTELNWLGYTREEVVGKLKMTDIMTPASLGTFAPNFAFLKERGWLRDLEFELMRKDGSVLPVLLSATAVQDEHGRFLRSRSTLVDYTNRKRAETALHQLNTNLESAYRELEAFAYSVSHDLRAPLRAIDGFSRILLEDYADKLDDEGRRLFGVVRANTEKMDRLITDLLALSRVTRAEMIPLRFDMTALARSACQEIVTPAAQQTFRVTIAPLPEAYGDPTLMRQVWNNLISNAIKYTRLKLEPCVEIGGYADEHQNVYYVKDNGIGFNPEYAHKLFGVFQRLQNAKDFEGSGVGLAIVQRIVQRHSGRVWAEGQIGLGATFYFTLPAAEQ